MTQREARGREEGGMNERKILSMGDFLLSAAKCNTDSSRGPRKTRQQSSYSDTLSPFISLIHHVAHSFISTLTPAFLAPTPPVCILHTSDLLSALSCSLVSRLAGQCRAYSVCGLCSADTHFLATHCGLIDSQFNLSRWV